MIVCSGCGTAMEDDLRFCTECGMPNPTTRSGETTVSLGGAPGLPGSAPAPVRFQSPSNSQTTVPFNQPRPGAAAPQGIPPFQEVATTPNRTPLIIVGAVVSGLLLLILGAAGSRFLLSENKPAETTSNNAQAVTPRNDTATTPEQTATQNQTQTQTRARNTAPPAFDEATLRREVIDTLNGWADAARAHDLDRCMSYYAERLDYYYLRTNVSNSYVRSNLTPAYTRYTTLDVQLTNISVAIDPSGAVATATFDKTYRFEGDKTLSGSVQQVLTLTRIDGRWLITGLRDLRVYYTNK